MEAETVREKRSGVEARQRHSQPGASASPLARALRIETSRLERLRVRAWLVLSVVVVAASLAVMLFDRVRSGEIGLALGALCLAWFVFENEALKRGIASEPHRWITFAIEQSLPWVMFAGIAVLDDAEAAMRGWGPPLVYAGVLIMGMLRLSARMSLLSGAIGAVLYVVVALELALPALPHTAVESTFQPVGQLVRGGFLLAAGGVCALVAAGLKQAVGGVVMTMRANELFGKYRLDAEIASGGMGVVWRATYCPEGGFKRPAAVKVIHPHLARDARFVDAFRNEAELCARLAHEHIVQVFDFGRVESTYFLAMEFVDGATLSTLMRSAAAEDRELPLDVIASIGVHLLDALQYAHHDAVDDTGAPLRVIHRDISPQNILVAKSGVVKLMDFGVAKALRDATTAETRNVVGHLTHMAPETFEGRVDERSDLFAVGIVLWELVCGCPLFKRDNDGATMAAILGAPVPAPSSVRPDAATWDAFFARALARPVEQRFPDAASMAAELRARAASADAVSRALYPRIGAPSPTHRPASLPASGSPASRETPSDA